MDHDPDEVSTLITDGKGNTWRCQNILMEDLKVGDLFALGKDYHKWSKRPLWTVVETTSDYLNYRKAGSSTATVMGTSRERGSEKFATLYTPMPKASTTTESPRPLCAETTKNRTRRTTDKDGKRWASCNIPVKDVRPGDFITLCENASEVYPGPLWQVKLVYLDYITLQSPENPDNESYKHYKTTSTGVTLYVPDQL